MLITKYPYKTYSRTDTENGRYYLTDSGQKLPSVTTILDKLTDKSFLVEWRNRIGDEEANKITAQSSASGTSLHKNLENYINGIDEIEGNAMSKMMFKMIKTKGLPKLTEAWGTEVELFYPELYAGTSDLIGVFDGEPAIIDFKNSRRAKKKDQIENYFLQLAAYAEAHNALYETTINCGVIMMVSQNGDYQEFVVKGEEFKHYTQLWYTKVYQYYDKYVLVNKTSNEN